MSFFHEIKMNNVNWSPTIGLLLVRAISAGMIWMLIGLFFQMGTQALLLPLQIPLMAVFAIPIIWITQKCITIFAKNPDLADGISGLLSIIFAIMIIVGDPAIFFAAKKWPEYMPISDFKIINFSIIIFVTKQMA